MPRRPTHEQIRQWEAEGAELAAQFPDSREVVKRLLEFYPPPPWLRVEVLLKRGEANVWYQGTIEGDRVRLDDYPHGQEIARLDDIFDWRPLT